MRNAAEAVSAASQPVVLAETPLRVGLASLKVRDLARVAAYYREILGLDTLASGAGRLLLHAGATPLLELTGDPALRPGDPRSAGLFHTAFLMPTRGDLAAWVRNAAAKRLPVSGASDHRVSEAIYLSDPEGNGVEIYSDRPSEAWPVSGGTIAMTTDPLDIDDLMRFDPKRTWAGAPVGLVVGHVHLQVGALVAAEAFYKGVLGFDISARYPGAAFYGAGGYHHQLATNIWNSRNAGPIDAGAAGLAGFELLARDPATLADIRARAVAAGLEAEEFGGGFVLSDPWGLPVTLRAG